MEIFGATFMGQRGFTDYRHISFACSVTKASVGARADPRSLHRFPRHKCLRRKWLRQMGI